MATAFAPIEVLAVAQKQPLAAVRDWRHLLTQNEVDFSHALLALWFSHFREGVRGQFPWHHRKNKTHRRVAVCSFLVEPTGIEPVSKDLLI